MVGAPLPLGWCNDWPWLHRGSNSEAPANGEDYLVADHYLPHIKMTRRNTSSDESFLRLHLLPRLGAAPMSEIDQQDLVEMHQSLLAQGYAKAMANKAFILPKIIFNLAMKLNQPDVSSNPAQGITLTDPQNAKERYLTKEEVQRLMVAIDQSENKQLKHIVTLLLLTGARKREILDARWEEVNLDRRYLRVPLSKSGKPRFIPLSLAAIKVLELLPRFDGCPYVVPNPDTGKPYGNLYVPWNTARKRAGLPDVRMHDLRHSYASNLVNAGTSIYVVSRALGHASLKNTARYSHLSQETLWEAADRAADVLVY